MTKPMPNVHDILDRIEDYSLSPEQYLNKRFGRGTWRFDSYANCYVVVDEDHQGPGRGFVIIDPANMRRRTVTLSRIQLN
jgi:hypothetical protein